MKKLLKEVYSQCQIDEQLRAGYMIITCPVCGNETFDDYFICPHCGWEYDGILAENLYSSVNKTTIKEYKDKFMRRYSRG